MIEKNAINDPPKRQTAINRLQKIETKCMYKQRFNACRERQRKGRVIGKGVSKGMQRQRLKKNNKNEKKASKKQEIGLLSRVKIYGPRR